MKRLILSILGVSLLVAVNPRETARAQEKQTLSALCDYLEEKLARDHIPGVSACIVKDDRVLWSQGFGFQNTDRRLPMTAQSVIGIASITKLFTATAILQLAERKRLSLDDPVNRYIPFRIQHPFHPDTEITIAQLLSHTASTSNGPSLWRSYSCDHQRMTLKEWAMAYFLPGGEFYHEEGNFDRRKPGEGFLYSNAGYTLLAYVVEAVSGLTFVQYLKENIFVPLEMHSTTFASHEVPADVLGTMYAYGYNMDLERDLMQTGINCGEVIRRDYLFPLCHYSTPTIGAGGLYSSIGDLSRFLIALMNTGSWRGHRILDKKSVAKMFSSYIDRGLLPGQFAAFGLGGYAMPLGNGVPVWGHTGADPGMSSLMLFSPDTRIGAIVLANRFADIRDLIEWMFAEGVGEYWRPDLHGADSRWSAYERNKVQHRVEIQVLPNYLPGDSKIYVIGNHRFLGNWVSDGIPMIPQEDRRWARTFWFPDSARIEFKITRGGFRREAVTLDGKTSPNHSLTVVKDTVVSIVVEDWKDQAQQ